MRRLAPLVLLPAVILAGCQTPAAANGPSRLAGQRLDAAVALYGPWSEEIQLEGQPAYIWRRTMVRNGSPEVCELKVELGFRDTIRATSMRGVTEACRLFATHTQSVDK
ncbi:MAG: hypothetical protein E7812_07770 [Phenylobacterium sp.]|nr:MAG: hypothetical protein E7812_07770 [Phenylobacterium sp.]